MLRGALSSVCGVPNANSPQGCVARPPGGRRRMKTSSCGSFFLGDLKDDLSFCFFLFSFSFWFRSVGSRSQVLGGGGSAGEEEEEGRGGGRRRRRGGRRRRRRKRKRCWPRERLAPKNERTPAAKKERRFRLLVPPASRFLKEGRVFLSSVRMKQKNKARVPLPALPERGASERRAAPTSTSTASTTTKKRKETPLVPPPTTRRARGGLRA